MAYNYGLVNFLQAKQLSSKQAIDSFLQEEGVTEFNSKHHNRVNEYIQANWVKFASHCDRGIKSGALKGKAVRLDFHHEEEQKRHYRVRDEFKTAGTTLKERDLLRYIKDNGAGVVHSIMQKAGLTVPKKDMSYESKTLRFLPIVRMFISNELELNMYQPKEK